MNKNNNLKIQIKNKVINILTGSIVGLLPLVFVLYIFDKVENLTSCESAGYGYLLILGTPFLVLCCLVFLTIFSLIRKTALPLPVSVISFFAGIIFLMI